jgi:hypothetical protein
MKLTAKYRKKDKIAGRNIAGESFLIPVCGKPADMENIFILNPMADFIWQRLDGEQTLAAILAAIVEGFAVDREQALADMTDLIGQLLGNALIEEVA